MAGYGQMQMMQRRPMMPMQQPRPAAPMAAPNAAPAPVAGGDPLRNPAQFQNIQGIRRTMLAQGLQGGAGGPDYLRNLMRKRAVGAFGNQQIRAAQMAKLYGLDPQQSRAALFQSGQDASRGLSSTLNDASLQGGQDYQRYILGLLGDEQGREDAYRQSEQQKADSRFNVGSFAGQLVGAVAGGAGAGLGERLAGGRRR